MLNAADARLVDATAVAAAVLVFVGLRRAPRVAFAAWLAVLCLVPVWVGIQVKVFVQPQVAVGLVVLVTLFPLRRSLPVRLTAPDLVVLAFVVSALTPTLLGTGTLTSTFDLLTQWSGAYALGRLVLHRVTADWVYRAVAVAFSVVAGLALVEALTGWNPFVHIPGTGDLYNTWSTIQLRGGLPRVEGAFGHSIALGGSLAMAIPFALAAPIRTVVKVPMALCILLACVPTFSRIGLGTAALSLLLMLLSARTGLSRRLRWGLAAGLCSVAAAVTPLVTEVFAAAGQEATGSAAYRGDLLSLIGAMNPLGLSDTFYRSPTGEVDFGSFQSIDSALVLIGLTYGAIPLACVLVGLVMAVVAVLRRRATPPTIALVAQLPAFATVALITQYAAWVWFVAGLAVATQSLRRTDGPQIAEPVELLPSGLPPDRWSPDVGRSEFAQREPQLRSM